MNATQFLTELWGVEPPGMIALWRLSDRRSWYLRSTYAAAALTEGQPDMYTGVALAHQDHGRSKRVTAALAAGIPGLWLDIDVDGGPDNKTGAAPDTRAAHQLAIAHCQPTLIVSSGYGLHAWYLFADPWRFTSVADQQHAATAAAQWYQLHRTTAEEWGWGLDHTHDLARLLRLPGTLNGKGGQNTPVDVAEHAGCRYQRAELMDLADQAGPVDLFSAAGADIDGQVVDVAIRPGAKPPENLMGALQENVPEFARAWAHARSSKTAAWSMSEWDLCLCSLAAGAGWTDQQLADLIAYHRRVQDPADTKGLRADYIRRTVAKARGDADRQGALQRMRARAGGIAA